MFPIDRKLLQSICFKNLMHVMSVIQFWIFLAIADFTVLPYVNESHIWRNVDYRIYWLNILILWNAYWYHCMLKHISLALNELWTAYALHVGYSIGNACICHKHVLAVDIHIRIFAQVQQNFNISECISFITHWKCGWYFVLTSIEKKCRKLKLNIK